MKMRVISSSMFEDGSNDRADNSNKEGNPEKTTNDYIHNVDEMENETLEDHLKKVEDAYLDLKKQSEIKFDDQDQCETNLAPQDSIITHGGQPLLTSTYINETKGEAA